MSRDHLYHSKFPFKCKNNGLIRCNSITWLLSCILWWSWTSSVEFPSECFVLESGTPGYRELFMSKLLRLCLYFSQFLRQVMNLGLSQGYFWMIVLQGSQKHASPSLWYLLQQVCAASFCPQDEFSSRRHLRVYVVNSWWVQLARHTRILA